MRTLHKEETVSIASLSDLEAYVGEFVGRIGPHALVLLSGPLGAGKTQFVRYFAGALGVLDVSSPSFALHNEYVLPDTTIDHVDLYRLGDEMDLESMGFWDLFEKDHGYILVEWADRIDKNMFPLQWPVVEVQIIADRKVGDTRILQVRHFA